MGRGSRLLRLLGGYGLSVAALELVVRRYPALAPVVLRLRHANAIAALYLLGGAVRAAGALLDAVHRVVPIRRLRDRLLLAFVKAAKSGSLGPSVRAAGPQPPRQGPLSSCSSNGSILAVRLCVCHSALKGGARVRVGARLARRVLGVSVCLCRLDPVMFAKSLWLLTSSVLVHQPDPDGVVVAWVVWVCVACRWLCSCSGWCGR